MIFVSDGLTQPLKSTVDTDSSLANVGFTMPNKSEGAQM